MTLKGKQFGRLTVLRWLHHNRNSELIVEAECACGTVKSYVLSNLKSGNTKSCGCLQRETASWIQRNRLDPVSSTPSLAD